MNAGTRAAIAYIVGSMEGNAGSVYDYARRKYIQFTGSATMTHVSVFDYDQECYITGNGANGNLNLYHYGSGSYIQLTIKGNHFHGFDYDSGSDFNGTKAGRMVSVYDYGVGSFFQYSV